MNVSPSQTASGCASTSDRSTSPVSRAASRQAVSPPTPAETPNHAAIISRRDFLAGSTAALVLSALGTGRAAAGTSKLRVGFIIPETGPLAAEAASLFAGFQLFLKENGAVASGIEVLKRDSGPEDQKTLEGLTEFVVNREVHVLIAPPTTEGSEKAIHAVTGSNVILLITNASVRWVGGEFCLPGSFRVCANNYQAAQPLAAWALKNVGRRIFITGEDDGQGNEQADYFAYGFERAGGTFGDRMMLSSATGKMQTVLDAIQRSEPNMVFAPFEETLPQDFSKRCARARQPRVCP